MKQRGMLRFLLKASLLSLPLLLLSVLYVSDDPFKVIRSYACYYRPGYPSLATLNRDYVSLETFLRHQSRQKWDSFILGNSRSIFYEVKDWASLIGSRRTYHFDAAGESLYGITRKLQFLERYQAPMSNALIILDAETLNTVINGKDHLFIKHPLLSGQPRLDFQLEFFKTFFSAKFLLPYLQARLSSKMNPLVSQGIPADSRSFDYDVRHNEMSFGLLESLIARNPDAYYLPRKAAFYTRPPQPAESPPVIRQPQKTMLLEIARILNSRHTRYRIIINPLYDQKPCNHADLAYLRELFGNDRVFDFSGVNPITSDYRNYYDDSHYRPHVAKQIMSAVYANPQ
jgi:hypothetical protein